MDLERHGGRADRRESVTFHRFSTDAFAPSRRFDAWCDYVGSLNEVVVPRESRARVSATTANRQLGRVMLGLARTPEMRLLRDAAMARRDDFDHWVLRISLRGEVTSRSCDRACRTRPGQLVLETLAAPFEDDWEAGEWVTAMFPRDLPRGLARRDPRGCVGPLAGASARFPGDFLISLAGQMTRARPEDLPRLGEAAEAMICATLGGPRDADAAGPAATPLRARVDRVIRRNIASARLDPERVAELAGLSRSSLYRLFEGEGGVAAHIRRVRLDGVRADLADPEKAVQPICRIAESWGFYSIASFNRSFREVFGITPGEVRQGLRHAALPPVAPRPRLDRFDLSALLPSA